MALHFLHIGKTGGTALKAVLQPRPELGVITHPHETPLTSIPAGEPVFFAIRHPVDRFVSGFNSRLRCGRPRNNVPWTPGEARAFAIFDNPNALAESLSAADPVRRRHAEDAMREIEHARPLTYWLSSPETLASREADIRMICDIRTLSMDFALLADRMNWSGELSLPRDPLSAHKTPAGFRTNLSDTGRRNLLGWYEADLLLYGAALALRAKMTGAETAMTAAKYQQKQGAVSDGRRTSLVDA